MSSSDPSLAPLNAVQSCEVGGVRLEIVRAGAARVKRMTYPAGFRWSTHMKPVVGTEFCKHAHVGYLAKGRIRVQYADGCTADFQAPQVVAIEPDHDAWVVGDEPAVLVEIDFERRTLETLGMPVTHHHGEPARHA